MEHLDAVRLGLILAIQAEIDGMKAENMLRQQNKEGLAFGIDDFQTKADDLRNLAHCHNEQL